MMTEIKNTTELLATLPMPIEPGQPAALVPREKPMTADDFDKVERVIAQNFRVEVPKVETRVPVRDDLGHIYRWEYMQQDGDPKLVALKAVDPRLFDAVKRPATPAHVAIHLTRLAAHLRHTKGDGAWQVVIEDVARDLIGVSEWAVVKACAAFRAGSKPFFPDTPELLASIRKWDAFAKRMGNADELPRERAKRVEHAKAEKTPESRAAVAKVMHEAGFHASDRSRSADFCALCRAEIEQERGA